MGTWLRYSTYCISVISLPIVTPTNSSPLSPAIQINSGWYLPQEGKFPHTFRCFRVLMPSSDCGPHGLCSCRSEVYTRLRGCLILLLLLLKMGVPRSKTTNPGLRSMSMSIMVSITQSTARSHSLADSTTVVETSFQVMAPVIASDISGSQSGRPA